MIAFEPRTIICAVFASPINKQLFVAAGERFLNSLLGVGVRWAHWLEVWAGIAGLHSNPGMEIITSSARNLGPEDLFIAPSLLMKYAKQCI